MFLLYTIYIIYTLHNFCCVLFFFSSVCMCVCVDFFYKVSKSKKKLGRGGGGGVGGMVVAVALLFYVHGKHLRSCRDGQLT